MKQVNILIADDHELVLDGIQALLDPVSHINIAGRASNGVEVLDQLRRNADLDLVILDINMPEMDGIEVTQHIKDSGMRVKVLILSMHNRTEFIDKLVEVGADGYLLKNSGKVELVKAIDLISSGGRYFCNEVVKSNFNEKLIALNSHQSELSPREKEVVQLIAKGMSSQQIALVLKLSPHTIDSHRKKILSKLGVKNSVEIAKYALRKGILKGFDIV